MSNDAYAWTGAATTSQGYAANGLNQYTNVGSRQYLYDGNGNLTGQSIPKPPPLPPATTTYVYDVENRLVSVSTGVTLRYDPLGRLYELAGPSGGAGSWSTTFALRNPGV